MRPLATALLIAALAPAAAPQPEDHTRVPMDPGAICDALRDAYTERPVEERIIVSVTRNAVTRSEPITMRLWPAPDAGAPTLELRLGPLTLWTTDDTLYAIHEDDDAAYFSEPITNDGPLEALRRAVPPIPLPELVLALTDHACPDRLPYAPALQWTDALVNAEAHPAQAHVTGKSTDPQAAARVELIADLEPPALRWFVIENKDEALRIEGEIRRAPAPDARTTIDLATRRRVATLAELAPLQSVLRLGDALPTMMVHPAGPTSPGVTAPLKPVRGPAVIVLFTEWNRDVPAALAVAQQAIRGFDDYTLYPVAVLDLEPGGPDARARINAIQPKLGDLPLYYTTDLERTIRRVNPYAKVALVVVDDRQIVRMTERIDHFTSLDEPGVMAARIAAAITAR